MDTLTSAFIKLFKFVKGGEGSGNFGHEGRPGEQGGSVSGTGGSVLSGGIKSDQYKVPTSIRAEFESKTLPLRRNLKFDDQVFFYNNGKIKLAQVSGFGAADRNTLKVKDHKTGEEWTVPRTELRMPKGGFRTRGE